MTDDDLERCIRASLARDAARAPDAGGLRAPTGSPAPRRDRVWVLAVAAVLVVGVATAVVAGRGGATDTPTATDSRELSCAGDVVTTTPQERPRVPAYDTPLEAARDWAGPGAGEVEVDPDGTRAYLLRDDGSVRAVMRLASTRDDLGDSEPTQISVDGSSVCADEVSSQPWDGGSLLSCPPGEGVVQAVVTDPPVTDRRSTSADSAAARVRTGGRYVAPVVRITTGARSGDATAVVRLDRDDLVVRVLRQDDVWRVTELARCESGEADLKDLRFAPGGPPVPVVTLTYGHCWTNPITFQGQSWEVRRQDDFGSGGSVPDGFTGYGALTRDGDRLRYVDVEGKVLVLLPTGSPGVAEKKFCA